MNNCDIETYNEVETFEAFIDDVSNHRTVYRERVGSSFDAFKAALQQYMTAGHDVKYTMPTAEQLEWMHAEYAQELA